MKRLTIPASNTIEVELPPKGKAKKGDVITFTITPDEAGELLAVGALSETLDTELAGAILSACVIEGDISAIGVMDSISVANGLRMEMLKRSAQILGGLAEDPKA